jgi:hypothetical protein
MENIIRAKHVRAARIIRLKRLRIVHTAFIEMTKIMRQLRVKQNVLRQNVRFIRQRESLRKWFKRAKVTIYMRMRSKKMDKEWNLKLVRTCFDAIKQDLISDRRFITKIIQVIKRSRNLDTARAFQHWHHTAKSMNQRDNEATNFGSRSLG